MTETQSNDTQPTSPPAGWYPYPPGSNNMRWWNGAQWGDTEPRPTEPQPAEPQPSESHALDNYPALKEWKTSVGFSVLGLVAAFVFWLVLVVLFEIAIQGYVGRQFSGLNATAGLFAGLITNVFCIVYVFVFYLSYFKKNPRITSRKAISFLNFFCGNVLFGALWNCNLTRSHTAEKPIKGISYIYAVALSILALIAYSFQVVTLEIPKMEYAKMYYQQAYSQSGAGQASSSESDAPVPVQNDEMGISYTIPAGWRSVPLSNVDNAEVVIAKLNPTNTSKVVIGIARDTEMSAERFGSITAEDVESLFREPLLSEGFTKWESEGASKVVLGDCEYWSIEGRASNSVQEFRLAYWFTAQNGYMYSFELNDYIANEQYASYVDVATKLISGAKYE